MNFLLLPIVTACVCTMALARNATAADQPAQTFTITEAFGLAHPKQVIDFDLKRTFEAGSFSLIGPDGQEAACQLIDGGRTLAVETDLPAHTTKTWKLYTGRRPVAQGNVRIEEHADWIEITNGLTGVRIVRTQPGAARALAPVQGLRLRSGKWTGIGPNFLQTPRMPSVQRMQAGLDWPYDKALGHEFADVASRSIKTDFLERGSVKTVVQVSYRFVEPAAATYRCTVELLAGQPSLLITEEAQGIELIYELDLKDNFAPDTARFRGVDPQQAGLGDETEAQLNVDLALRTFVWDCWSNDGGVQVSTFRDADPPDGDLFGTFPGPTSRALGARAAGTFLMCKGGRTFSRMQLYHSLPEPDRPFQHNRYSWGIFMGLRGDVRNPDAIQQIDLERNRIAGINLNKIHRMDFDIPEPPGGFGALYMSRPALNRLVKRIHSDADYRNFIYDAEPNFRPLLFLLDDPALHADPGGQRVREVASRIEEKARETLRILMYEKGTEDKRTHNYEGVFKVINEFYLADQVLASSEATEADKAKARKAIVLFATIWSDDDHSPFQPDTHLNYGSQNMPLTFLAFRDMFILYLARHPQFQHRIDGIIERTRTNLKTQINEHGAHMGSMHYVEASFSALVNTMLQLKQAGAYDFFQNDAEHAFRLTRFAEFTMASMTPHEPRYGMRKFISTGDSACESSDRYGVLGTAFADSNVELSRRLLGAWRQNGKRHSSMFGSSVLKIDDTLPDTDPAMKSIDIPGYYSMFRAGWGTPNETAVWFINGEWYRDHKHQGDGGEVIIYALGAPLSLDPGSMYSPRLASAEHHSVVQGAGVRPTVEDYKTLSSGGFARAVFDLEPMQQTDTRWTRSVSLAMLTASQPVIAIQDSFNRQNDRLCHFNLMSEGAAQASTIVPGIDRLTITGQSWPLHPTRGIDWDLFVVADQPVQIDWGAVGHQWNPVLEMDQFERANGRPFDEMQQVLKLNGRGSFRTFIVPYFKGKRPAVLTAKLLGGDVAVTVGEQTVRFHPDGSFGR